MSAPASCATVRNRLRGLTALAIATISTFTALNASGAESPALKASEAILGAANLKSLEISGTGRWYQFGQSPSPGTPWPPFDMSSYKATIDYEHAAARVQSTRKQVVEPNRVRPAPVEQKNDQYVSGSYAWNVGGNPAVPQPQAAALEERIADIWATPQGFLKAAAANHAQTKDVSGGLEVSFTQGKSRFLGKINASHQVERVLTWIDNPILGDTPVEYLYSDYKNFDGLSFPAHIVRKQGGYPVLDLNISAVTANAEANIAVPAEVGNAPATKVTVTSELLAPGVFYLKGGTHHSVAIEQKDHIVLIEAPLNEARSEALIAKLHEIAPDKPVRFLINTHHHFDHSGGLRTFVEAEATIVTHQSNKPYYEKAWAAPHTLNPDRLAKSKRQAKFETFASKHVLSDGNRSIEIHEIVNSGHNDAFAFIYLPAEKILIEADAYTPAAANAPAPTSINPYSVNLYDNIKRLGLDVAQIAALHGPRVTTLADLQAAIGIQADARN